MDDTTGKRLRELREARKMSQEDVAKLIGVGRTTYLKYESDENRPVRKIRELTSLFNVTADYLLCNETQPAFPKPSSALKNNIFPVPGGNLIPLVGTVRAGEAIYAEQNIEDYIEVDSRYRNCFSLRVTGDSMKPKLLDGDIVIIRPDVDTSETDMSLVSINDDEATVKYVQRVNGCIFLIAENRDVYNPHFYSEQDIIERNIHILGKVVSLQRNF